MKSKNIQWAFDAWFIQAMLQCAAEFFDQYRGRPNSRLVDITGFALVFVKYEFLCKLRLYVTYQIIEQSWQKCEQQM